ELYRSFLRLGINVTDQDIEDIIYFLVDVYNKCNDQQIGYDEIDWDQLTEDFREILSNVNDSSFEDFDDQHIILILDKNVQMLPWESLPCLRKQPVSRLPSLSFLRDRILSIQHQNIPHNINTNTNNNHQKNQQNKQNIENIEFLNHVVDKNKCYYVLNPSQDLKNTQKEFETFVKSFQNWDGVIGHSPSEQEIKNGLSNQDLY
ncbi:8283_t:CDS:2, partial [Dentiscutata erythropus]